MNNTRYRFETGAVTHSGCVRDHNEDRFLAASEQGIWLVADGMGGHFGGDLAAQMIVDRAESVSRASSAPDLNARFRDRIVQANQDIRDHSARNDGATIGATLATLLIHESNFAGIWCGDSRLYRLRDGALTQLSRDHTEVQELLDSGAITAEQAETWPRKNVITRAIGVEAEADLDHVSGDLRDRDTFLLCSDGLTGHMADDEIAAIMRGRSSQAACDALLEETLQRGASDNVTLIIVRCAHKTMVSDDDIAGREFEGRRA
ncbi:PP2C family protein-serine/threonine phosphatase [Salibaculum sp.]|uniref:PP2C family protein-serine/threonine phosphatase n=1 Tax=Salibaculum sp. TaxID=2855480 RepID=UPI002B462D56|nr:protein phosphatase 2C domain-containing protein [Salibaculum sp.]HKL69588.1 protein phosphatase 2C domain-containing protein [Salibaculum sp.]